jgi:hypothetical protein
MGELLPIVGGVIVGASVGWIAAKTLRRWLYVVGVVATALLAAGFNGELAESPGFLIVDTLIAAVAVAATVTLMRWAQSARRVSRS